ncbi:hypothetical protein ACF0H5_000037 [Mactra antiquata]
MVLSDMPFERSRLLHSRYTLLQQRPGSAPPPTVEDDSRNKITKEYAAFLKDQERKVGPDGFLDSTRMSHTFYVKKEKEKSKAKARTPKPSVVRLSTQIENDKKDHDKRIKVIEDHMWQHKQEERELKRTEGDIIKNQRSVRHMLRDYENVINKKRMEEEKKLNTGLEKYTVLRRDHVHKSHDVGSRLYTLQYRITKSRIQQNHAYEHSVRDKGRRSNVTKSDLARTYKSKMSEMELKQIELLRLNQEFESKMRQKEHETHKLQQELADLAIALNMEAQKGRTQSFEAHREKKKETTNRIAEDLNSKQALENKLARSDGDNKQAEMTKRKLSADLVLTKAHIAIRQRDEQRHLADTQMRLDDNSNVQHELNEAAFHAEMDLKSKQMQQNIEAHNTRRVKLLKSHMSQKKMTEEAKQKIWEARFKKRASEKARLEHEDSLKFFQKMVNKGEDQEQNLYNKVRNAEYSRQKQEQTVRRLQQQLSEIRRKNATSLTKEMVDRNRQEMELEQLLLREKAELDKTHAEREESYYTLQVHRHALKTDRYNLEEHDREHTRLQQIAGRHDTVDMVA